MTKQPKLMACPTEEQEQKALAKYLDFRGLCWFHVPNGGNRDAITGKHLKQQGVKPGVPDILIFRELHQPPTFAGVAIELKRQRGGVVTKDQRRWIDLLMQRGWKCEVCRGAHEAVAFIEEYFPSDTWLDAKKGL